MYIVPALPLAPLDCTLSAETTHTDTVTTLPSDDGKQASRIQCKQLVRNIGHKVYSNQYCPSLQDNLTHSLSVHVPERLPPRCLSVCLSVCLSINQCGYLCFITNTLLMAHSHTGPIMWLSTRWCHHLLFLFVCGGHISVLTISEKSKTVCPVFNTLRLEQNWRISTVEIDIFKCIILNEITKGNLHFLSNLTTENKFALIQVMFSCWTRSKPLPTPMQSSGSVH